MARIIRNFRSGRYHLVAAMPGGIDVGYAILRVNAELIASIQDGMTLLRLFYGAHPGYGGLYRQGIFSVVFFKDFPDGFDHSSMKGDPDKGGAIIAGLIMDEFEQALHDQDLHVQTECDGIRIDEEAVRIVGYEKHADTCMESDNLFRWLLSDENETSNETSGDTDGDEVA